MVDSGGLQAGRGCGSPRAARKPSCPSAQQPGGHFQKETFWIQHQSKHLHPHLQLSCAPRQIRFYKWIDDIHMEERSVGVAEVLRQGAGNM